jgi:CAAX protease family protein
MWFLAASAVLFGPLLLTAALVLHRERRTGRPGPWVARLWLHPMKGGDWLWAIGGARGRRRADWRHRVRARGAGGQVDAPSFVHGFRAARSRPVLDFLRRGSRFLCSTSSGKSSYGGVSCCRGKRLPSGRGLGWSNGILWLLFHAAFSWQVLVTLVPITLILPYVVQRRRSTWAGVIIHAGFGGTGFLVLACGLA